MANRDEPAGTSAGSAPAGSSLPPVAPDSAGQKSGDEIDHVIPSRSYRWEPLVGIGGSAGSIPMLLEFFRTMPAASGMAFVVTVHFPDDQESALPEILQREKIGLLGAGDIF